MQEKSLKLNITSKITTTFLMFITQSRWEDATTGCRLPVSAGGFRRSCELTERYSAVVMDIKHPQPTEVRRTPCASCELPKKTCSNCRQRWSVSMFFNCLYFYIDYIFCIYSRPIDFSWRQSYDFIYDTI